MRNTGKNLTKLARVNFVRARIGIRYIDYLLVPL